MKRIFAIAAIGSLLMLALAAGVGAGVGKSSVESQRAWLTESAAEIGRFSDSYEAAVKSASRDATTANKVFSEHSFTLDASAWLIIGEYKQATQQAELGYADWLTELPELQARAVDWAKRLPPTPIGEINWWWTTGVIALAAWWLLLWRRAAEVAPPFLAGDARRHLSAPMIAGALLLAAVSLSATGALDEQRDVHANQSAVLAARLEQATAEWQLSEAEIEVAFLAARARFMNASGGDPALNIPSKALRLENESPAERRAQVNQLRKRAKAAEAAYFSALAAESRNRLLG